MAVLFALISACSYAASNLFVRKGRQALSANLVVICKLIIDNICNVVLLTILFLCGKLVLPSLSSIPFFMLGGLFANFLGRVTQVPVINYLGASRTGILGFSSPVVGLVLGVAFLGDRFSFVVFCGLMTILLGLFLLAIEQSVEQKAAEGKKKYIPVHYKDSSLPDKLASSTVFYVTLGIMAGVFFGVASFWRKIGLNISSTIVPAVSIGTFTALVFSIIYAKLMDKSLTFRDIAGVLKQRDYVLSGITSTMGQYALFFALSLSMVSIVNVLRSTDSLFTLLFSRIFMQKMEAVSKKVLVCGLLVVFGMCLVVFG